MRLILNLGCGSKTSAYPEVVNVDWSITLYIRKNPFLRGIVPFLLNEDRLSRLRSLPSNISGTSRQKPLRRRVENLLLGDARKRGETHQWMYGRVNLTSLLSRLGYRDVRVQSHRQSGIPDWKKIGLDLDAHTREYKPGSLYVEATK